MSLFPELEQEEELFPELKTSQEKEVLFPELNESTAQNEPAKAGLFPELKQPSSMRTLAQSTLEKVPFIGDALKTVQKVGEDVPSVPPPSPEAEVLTETIAPGLPMAVQPLVKSNIGKRLTGATASGAAGTLAGMAGFAPAVEAKLGFDTPVGRVSGDIAKSLNDLAGQLQPEDPQFVDKLASGAGSMALFMAPGAGTSMAVSAIPRMGLWAARLAPAIGASVSTVLESATEAGGVYNDLMSKPEANQEEAARAAEKDFYGNLILVGLTNKLGIFGEKGRALKRALVSAPLEAVQEAGQSILESVSKGEAIDWKDVADSAKVGAVLGGGMGAVMSEVLPEAEKPKETNFDTLLAPEGKTYLTEKFPALSKALEGQTLPLPPKEAQETIKKAVAAGEEVLLRGGNPIEAQRAALSEFKRSMDQAKPVQETQPIVPPAPTPQETSAIKVSENVASQLQKAGYDPETAGTYSKIYEKAFKTLGERAGIDPLELFNRYGLQIQKKEGTQEPAGQAFEQGQEIRPFKNTQEAIAFGKANQGSQEAIQALETKMADLDQRIAKEKDVDKAFALTFERQFYREARDTAQGKAEFQQGPKEEVTNTPAFKNWFGKSKVVDESGKPLVVYHGTTEQFNEFKPTSSIRMGILGSKQEVTSPAFFFTANKEVADFFGKNRADYRFDKPWLGKTMDVFLKIDNPIDLTKKTEATINKLKKAGIDVFKKWGHNSVDYKDNDFAANLAASASDFWQILDSSENVEKLRAAGYDGAILSEGKRGVLGGDKRKGMGTSYAVFDSTQIKSATGNRGTFDPNSPNILEQPAFHGSPHKFDKFSLQKIGTGEGNQAYGFGLYFASRREVAEYYRDSLSDGKEGHLYKVEIPEDDQYLDWDKPMGKQSEAIQAAIKKLPHDFVNVIKNKDWYGENFYQTLVDTFGSAESASEQLASLGIAGIKYKDQGSRLNSYVRNTKDNTKFEVADDKTGKTIKTFNTLEEANSFKESQGTNNYVLFRDDFISMDRSVESSSNQNQGDSSRADAKFLSDVSQSPAFIKHGFSGLDTPSKRMMLSRMFAVAQDLKVFDTVVRSLPVDVVDMLRTQKLTPQMLFHDKSMLGDLFAVNGNKPISVTPDAANATVRVITRAATEKIDPSLTEGRRSVKGDSTTVTDNGTHASIITNETFDDKLVKIMEYEQSGKGEPRARIRFGQDRQFNIDLLKGADLTSFLHESGHFYLEVLKDLASDPKASADIKGDFDTLLKWFNVKSAEEIGVDQHEQFARGFEAYLMEGKAPTSALEQVFERFKEWLLEIYKTIENLNVELTPEVRRVFDNLLSTKGDSSFFQEGFNSEPDTYVPSRWAKVKQELLDRFDPIKYHPGKKIATQFPQAGGNYSTAYVMARLLPGKIRGISETILKDLNKTLAPIRNFKDRMILNKIYSLRNYADLDRIGKTTSGITEDMALKELDALRQEIGSEKFKTISGVADQLAEIQNNKGLQMLVDAKVITPEKADLYRTLYPNYLRSEILDEELSVQFDGFRSPDNGEPIGRINKKILKHKKGTSKKINEDVLDVVRRSLVAKVALAQKQQVIDQVAADFGREIGTQAYREGRLVIDVDPSKIPDGYVKSLARTSGGKIFAVRADIAEMLEGLNHKDADLVTKSMTSFNRLFRMGATTLRVPFIFNNVFRDVQESMLKARTVSGEQSQLKSYIQGAFHALKQTFGIRDSVYEAWKKAGGAYGGAVTSIPKEVNLPFRTLPLSEQAKEALKSTVTLPFEAVAKVAEFSENTSRLAEWLRVSKTELPEQLKALQSRDITVDFEKFGDSMRRLNQWIPFLNANVQGKTNDLRNFKDQPFTATLRTGIYIILPTVLAYAYNQGFDDDDDIDPWIKNTYWYFNTGIKAMIDGKKLPVLITIRKGEFAQLVSYYVQSLLEYAKDDPNFKERLKDFTLQGTVDSMVSTIIPPVMRVPVEEAANRSFFTGNPIISMSIQNVEPRYQFKPGTTDTARKLGEVTGLSPARIEHVLGGFFPATGQVFQVSDMLLKPDVPVKRQDKSLYPLQSFTPMVRTPSGYFSQEESKAREFEQTKKIETRTGNFLFENAYRQYMRDRTPENEKILMGAAKKLPGKDRARLMKKVNQENVLKAAPSNLRAYRNLPKKLRKEYLMESKR